VDCSTVDLSCEACSSGTSCSDCGTGNIWDTATSSCIPNCTGTKIYNSQLQQCITDCSGNPNLQNYQPTDVCVMCSSIHSDCSNCEDFTLQCTACEEEFALDINGNCVECSSREPNCETCAEADPNALVSNIVCSGCENFYVWE
jgi:hypothetical protein